MPVVKMPDGALVNIPDNPTPEEQEMMKGLGIGGSSVIKEVGKGIGRGLLGIPNLAVQAGDYLERKMPTPDWLKIPDRVGVRGALSSANEVLEPTPETNLQRMAGTGAEIFSGAMLGGGTGKIGKTIFNAAVPAAGGVAGEQLGGDVGKVVGTLAAPFAQGGVSRVLSPQGKKGAEDALRNLTSQGVQPTVGQSLGGLPQRIENWAVFRDFSAPGKARANAQWNKAVYNNALAPIKGQVDEVGNAGFAAADDIVDKFYTDVLSRTKPMKFDLPLARGLRDARTGIPNQQWQGELVDHYNAIVRPHWQGGQMSPQTFKEIDSQLGTLYRRLNKSSEAHNMYVAEGIKDIQDALRDTVARQNPNVAPQLEAANKAYSNMIRVERAVVNAKDADGIFTPKELHNAVKAVDSSRGNRKTKFAKGASPMQDVAQEGRKVLGEPFEPPGSPYGLMHGVLGGAMALPLKALYSETVQKALPYALTKRPDMVRNLGNATRSGGMEPGVYGAIPNLEDLPLFSRNER